MNRDGTLFVLPGVDASRVYVGASALGCFYGHISTQTFRKGADRVAGQLRGDKECPFSGVTKSGRVWRRVRDSVGKGHGWECVAVDQVHRGRQ